MRRRPPTSTRTDTPCPYTTLVRSWEPGLRSAESGSDLISTLWRIRSSLRCDTRLHLRWETFALDQLPTVMQWLSLDPKPIVALNDHTTGTLMKGAIARKIGQMRSEEHTSELQSLMRISYAVFCLKKKNNTIK